MPFIIPPPTMGFSSYQIAWQSECHRDYQKTGKNGDAVFMEIERDDGDTLILLLDAVHHGDDAAKLIDYIQTELLRDSRVSNQSPEKLLNLLHGLLAPALEEGTEFTGKFACASATRLSADGRSCEIVSGALPHPFFSPDGQNWEQIKCNGAALGWSHFPECAPKPQTLTVSPTSRLVLCSDGVTEAFNENETEQITNEEICHSLGIPNVQSTAEQLQALFQSLQSYSQSHWLSDDTTAVAVSWNE